MILSYGHFYNRQWFSGTEIFVSLLFLIKTLSPLVFCHRYVDTIIVENILEQNFLTSIYRNFCQENGPMYLIYGEKL